MTTLKGSGMTQPTFSGVCLWDSLSSIMKAQKIVLSPTMLKYEDRHIRLHQGHSYELLKWWSFSYYFTLSFTFWPLAWEKVMAPHSSTLAWKISWAEEPDRLQSMGSLKSRLRLSDFTFTFLFHALEKEMATHSSVLAWRIPGTGEPGGLPYMGSHRVGHNWSNAAAAATISHGKNISRSWVQITASPLHQLRKNAYFLWDSVPSRK